MARVSGRLPGQLERVERKYRKGILSPIESAHEEMLRAITSTIESDLRRDGLTDVVRSIAGVRIAFMQRLTGKVSSLVRGVQGDVSSRNLNNLRREFKTVLGITPHLSDPALERIMDAHLQSNVAKITTISQQHFREVEDVIRAGYNRGSRPEVIGRRISERFNVTQSRGQFIARDQIASLNGQLERARQTELGVNGYIWQTVRDERVRDSHESKHGQRFLWSAPPADTGHPGEDFNCRCVGEPDFSTVNPETVPVADGVVILWGWTPHISS